MEAAEIWTMDKRMGRDSIQIRKPNHWETNTIRNIPKMDKCNHSGGVEVSKDEMESKEQQYSQRFQLQSHKAKPNNKNKRNLCKTIPAKTSRPIPI